MLEDMFGPEENNTDQAPPCEVTWHRSLAHFNQRSFSQEAMVFTRASVLTRNFSVEIAEQFFTKKSENDDV